MGRDSVLCFSIACVFFPLEAGPVERDQALAKEKEEMISKYRPAVIDRQPEATASLPSGSYQALFYNSCYYLPTEQEDLSALLAQARQTVEPVFVHADELLERSNVKPVSYELGVCLAPYFISDYLPKPQTVTVLDAAQAYTAQD